MKYTTSPSNLGTVLSVRGSVVDVQLNGRLPPIYSLLHAKEGTIALRSWRNSTSILFFCVNGQFVQMRNAPYEWSFDPFLIL
jgi:hypothetical protein